MENLYFKEKTKILQGKILSAKVGKGCSLNSDEIYEIIYLGLKEVAKDQKYYSINQILRKGKDELNLSECAKIIYNS